MNNTIVDSVPPAVTLIGRILLALIFVMSGFDKLTHYSGTETYMASLGIPMVSVLLPLTILVELGGGLLIVLGLFTRPAAILVFLFIIPTTLVAHHFWDLPAAQAMMQQINFMKNLSIMGGMLMLAAYGPGSWSLDARRVP